MTARSRTRIRSRPDSIIPASGRSIPGCTRPAASPICRRPTTRRSTAFQLLSRLEGIIPALEPAHAIAKVMELAPKRPKDHLMVVNLSGRGDKDVPQVGDILKGRKK